MQSQKSLAAFFEQLLRFDSVQNGLSTESVKQSQKIVNLYFYNKQLLPFGFTDNTFTARDFITSFAAPAFPAEQDVESIEVERWSTVYDVGSMLNQH